MARDDRYWASMGLLEGDNPDDIIEEVREQWKQYHQQAERGGQTALWKKARSLYYGQDGSGGYSSSHYVTVGGDQDERLYVRSNHLRSLARRLLIMATEQRPAFECTTTNDSPQGMDEARLGQQLIDFYLDDGDMENVSRQVAEKSLLDGRAYMHAWWDPMKGEASMPDPGDPSREIRSGDLVYEAVSQYDCAREVRANAKTPLSWAIVRRYDSKWNLAARFPQHAEDIIAYSPDAEQGQSIWGQVPEGCQDYVPVFVLYHEQTDAMPNGRQTVIVGDSIVFDGAMAYERIPLIEMTPSELSDSPWGYSDLWDLFGLQHGYDAAVSSALSQQQAVAHYNLLCAKGQEVDAVNIAKGLRKIEYVSDGATQPPSFLEPPRISEAALKLRDLMKDDLEINSGVNAVARGSQSGSSGAQDALTQSMAAQYASGLIGSYASLLRQAAAHTIRLLQKFATIPRVAEIAGSNEMPAVKEFSAQDISSIRNVRVELSAPETRTVAGRDAMAQQLVQLFPGQISPEQYLAFRTTGRWQPLYAHQTSEVRLIREENDRLAAGQPVVALAIDHHMEHMKEHSCLLHRSEARLDNEFASRVLQHIQEHMALLSSTDPTILEAMGARMPSMPAAPEPGMGGQPPSGQEQAPAPAGFEPQGAQMPSMPENPVSGEQAPADGMPRIQ